MTKQASFDELMNKFNCAAKDYEDAHSQAEQTSGAETTARNRLSDTQKDLDEYFSDLKKNAHWNTYWHQKSLHDKHTQSG